MMFRLIAIIFLVINHGLVIGINCLEIRSCSTWIRRSYMRVREYYILNCTHIQRLNRHAETGAKPQKWGLGEPWGVPLMLCAFLCTLGFYNRDRLVWGLSPESPLNTPCVGLSCSKAIISQIPIFHMLPNFRQRFRKPQESTTEHQMRGGLVGACWTAKWVVRGSNPAMAEI